MFVKVCLGLVLSSMKKSFSLHKINMSCMWKALSIRYATGHISLAVVVRVILVYLDILMV